jgi:hypothetical protein
MKTIGMNWSALALKTPLESEGIGVHTRIITQKKITEDLWEHSQCADSAFGQIRETFCREAQKGEGVVQKY